MGAEHEQGEEERGVRVEGVGAGASEVGVARDGAGRARARAREPRGGAGCRGRRWREEEEGGGGRSDAAGLARASRWAGTRGPGGGKREEKKKRGTGWAGPQKEKRKAGPLKIFWV